eukprot:TRINITY_DN11700_c0_g1_i2.p1 TRINITY_DN11700_c0_g1~~TRINITY_DN11700_c0_g1_i2.p1  ORF type:complete len:147 (-),score=14.22 TRINITY_DN11700_c0_g1_i2:121-561(-)
MNEPLFGEQKPRAYLVGFLFTGILLVGCLVCIVISIVFSVKSSLPQHLASTLLIVLTAIHLAILFKWYRRGDLDPKFKFLLFFSVFIVVLACVSDQIYVWVPFPGVLSKCSGNNLYQPKSQTCITIQNWLDCSKEEKLNALLIMQW